MEILTPCFQITRVLRKGGLEAYLNNKDPDQPAEPHSLTRAFANVSTLGKHAYSNILKIVQPKMENFQIKNSDIFHIPAQNIDCGY